MRSILLAIVLLTSGISHAQVQYARYGAPERHHIVGISSSSPAVVQVQNPSVGGGANGTAGLAAGMVIDLQATAAVLTGGDCSGSSVIPNPAHGLVMIKAVVDSTHYSVRYFDLQTGAPGADIDTTGYTWCDGHAGIAANGTDQAGSVMLPYTLTSGPRGLLDGTNGTVMRKVALSTANGMASLAVSSGHIATITTGYNHGMTTGALGTLWNTTNSTLSAALVGTEYTVTVTSPTTFTFPVNSSIPAQDYTHNDHCGHASTPTETIDGTDNCVVWSQYAISTNPWYMATRGLHDRQINTDLINTTIYDQPGLGGTVGNTDGSFLAINVMDSEKFMIDKTNTALLNSCLFSATHFQRTTGVNFMINEVFGWNGLSNSDELFSSYGPLGMIWNSCGGYLTTAHQTEFKNKLYNTRNNPGVSCSPDIAVGRGEVFPRSHNTTILASGVSVAADSTSITLAAGDTAGTNFYVNNIVIVDLGGGSSTIGLIGAYNSSTKKASGITWDNGAPTTGGGQNYKIYATITLSGTTITGYNTKFQTDADPRAQLAAGDAVMAFNRWSTLWVYNQSYIQAAHSTIDSDTQISNVRNNVSVSAGATPQLYWFDKAWNNATTDCGLLDYNNYFNASSSFQALYPPNGGKTRDNTSSNNGLAYGNNNSLATSLGRLTVDLALADQDTRASQDAADHSSLLTDLVLGFQLQDISGPTNDGNNYGFTRFTTYLADSVWLMQTSLVGYPSLGPTSPWIYGQSVMKMLDTLSDLPGGVGSSRHVGRWGSQSFFNQIQAGVAGGFARDATMTLDPTSSVAKYYKSFWPDVLAPFGISGAVDGGQWGDAFLKIDPNLPSLNYTTLPTQYYFHKTDPATSLAVAGKAWPVRYTQDMMISRGGWDFTQCTPTCSGGTSHWLMFDGRTFLLDHDNKQMGRWCLYKVGYLMCSDDVYPGATTGIGIGDAVSPTGNDGFVDPTAIENMLRFSGSDTLLPGVGPAPPPSTPESTMPRFGQNTAGSLGPAWGDSSSRFAYSMADLTPAYLGSPNRIHRHVLDAKESGLDHLIFDFVDVDLSSATQIQVSYMYNQNGNTLAESSNAYTEPYLEGFTTCPGSHGCAGINTDRASDGILSQQAGTSADTVGPARTNAVNTKFFSPSTMFVQDDNAPLTVSAITAATPAVITAPSHGLTVGTDTQIQLYRGGGSWDAINGIRNVHVTDANTLTMTASTAGFSGSWAGTASYTTAGAQGMAHRVRVCGGASCAATTTTLEMLSVTKVCSTLSCSLPGASQITPDANWTGINTADTALIVARHGQLQSTVTAFNVTLASTGRVAAAGLAPGCYSLTIGATNFGTQCPGPNDGFGYWDTTGVFTGASASITQVSALDTSKVIVRGVIGVKGQASGH